MKPPHFKGLGYQGIHIGGVHRNFITVKRILDRMAEIEGQWREFIKEFDYPMEGGYYIFQKDPATGLSSDVREQRHTLRPNLYHQAHFKMMHGLHQAFFRFDAGPCVPPRMWELNDTPSWLNFHLKRDHQSASATISRFCNPGQDRTED